MYPDFRSRLVGKQILSLIESSQILQMTQREYKRLMKDVLGFSSEDLRALALNAQVDFTWSPSFRSLLLFPENIQWRILPSVSTSLPPPPPSDYFTSPPKTEKDRKEKEREKRGEERREEIGEERREERGEERGEEKEMKRELEHARRVLAYTASISLQPSPIRFLRAAHAAVITQKPIESFLLDKKNANVFDWPLDYTQETSLTDDSLHAYRKQYDDMVICSSEGERSRESRGRNERDASEGEEGTNRSVRRTEGEEGGEEVHQRGKSMGEKKEIENSNENYSIHISFELTAGAYATNFLREYFDTNES